MDAIILAAGVGSRLRPITNKKPKTLVEVSNRPMVAYILDALIAGGVTRAVVCTGYRSDQLEAYVLEHYANHIELVFVENTAYETTNNMYSLYLAREYLDGDTFVMNADLVFDPAIIAELAALPGSHVAVDVGRYMEESMKIEVQNGCISAIAKTVPPDRSHGCSIDVYKFDRQAGRILIKEITQIIEGDDDLNQWTEVVLDQVFASGSISAKPFDINGKQWFEIDDYHDLVQADMLFSPHLPMLKERTAFIVDKDGTLTLGQTPIPGADRFLAVLNAENKSWRVGSNNSSRTTDQHEAALAHVFPHLETVNAISSLDVAIQELKDSATRRLYWVANEAVSDYLSTHFTFDSEQPDAILLTYDDQITYAKLVELIRLVDQGIGYYATHTDLVCPTEDGFIPDIGSYIAMVEMATRRRPGRTFGKPQRDFIRQSLNALAARYDQAVLIGDRLYTDIAACEGKDILSVLVLSGETDRTQYEFSDIRADIIVPSVKCLVPYLR